MANAVIFRIYNELIEYTPEGRCRSTATLALGDYMMTSYSTEELYRGAGAFDQAMRIQEAIPGTANRMTPGVAVGIIAAAIRSNLPAAKLDAMIEGSFAHSGPFLKRILAMYEGDDWSVNLWHLLPAGNYKLCTDLCVLNPTWRYNRNGNLSLD